MSQLAYRTLICTGIALLVLFGVTPPRVAAQQAEAKASADSDNAAEHLQLHYLEIVTPDVDALCKQYSAVHGITFGEPVPGFGNARTAKLSGGGMIGIRGPMRATETPVIRPYALVKDLDKAVAAAAEAGAEVAIPRMEIPGGHGSIGIVIQGGIECGLWER